MVRPTVDKYGVLQAADPKEGGGAIKISNPSDARRSAPWDLRSVGAPKGRVRDVRAKETVEARVSLRSTGACGDGAASAAQSESAVGAGGGLARGADASWGRCRRDTGRPEW